MQKSSLFKRAKQQIAKILKYSFFYNLWLTPPVLVSKSSVKMLHERFIQLAKHRDNDTQELFMTPLDFEEIPELLKNPLGFRLIEAFFADAE